MLFAIDQQQYLQGYLPVVFAVLFVTNLNTVGNGAAGADRPRDHQQGERGAGGRARREGHALASAQPGRALRPPARAGGAMAETAAPSRPGRRAARPRRPARAAADAAGHRRAARRGRRLSSRSRYFARAVNWIGDPGHRRRLDRPGRAVRDRRGAGRAADDRRRVRPLRRRDDRQLGPAARLPRDARGHEHLAGDGDRAAVRRSRSASSTASPWSRRGCRASSSRSRRSSSSRASTPRGTLKLTGHDRDPEHRHGERLRLRAPRSSPPTSRTTTSR